MTKDNFQALDFYGKTIYIQEGLHHHLDDSQKTLLIMDKAYTDFNAVLTYQEERGAIQILPRWQVNFILEGEAIYILSEGGV